MPKTRGLAHFNADGFPNDWPLQIDKSFWRDWAFVRWQALRRNSSYQKEITKLYKNSPRLFESSEIRRFFRDYTPSPSRNFYMRWWHWAINQKGEIKSPAQLEIELKERLLAGSFTSKRVDFWPVSPDVCFPHPYFLDKLRPLPFSIRVKPVNRRQKTAPYAVLAETGLARPKYLKLDMSIPRDELRRQVVGYLKGLKWLQIQRQAKEVFNLGATVQRVMKQVPRRAMSIHADDIPYQFAAWDLRMKDLKFRQIAETLWGPFIPTYPDKSIEIQRAQDCYRKAEHLIKTII